MRSAHHIIAIGEGRIVEQGSFEELSSRAGYFNNIYQHEEIEETSAKEDIIPLIQTNVQKLRQPEPTVAQVDGTRQTGDLSVYNYYCKYAGWLNIVFSFSMSGASAFCVVFSSKFFPADLVETWVLIHVLGFWLQKWVTANSERPNENVGLYLGIYFLLGVASLATLWLFCR